MESDAQLLRRYVEEDSQEAFSELVRRYADFVYAAACCMSGSNFRFGARVELEKIGLDAIAFKRF